MKSINADTSLNEKKSHKHLPYIFGVAGVALTIISYICFFVFLSKNYSNPIVIVSGILAPISVLMSLTSVLISYKKQKPSFILNLIILIANLPLLIITFCLIAISTFALLTFIIGYKG